MTQPTAAILDAEGVRLTPAEKAFFRDVNPFGFILFARNIETPDQTRALCDELRATVGRDALITVDQEGGRVQRLRRPHWRDWTPPLDFVRACGDHAARAMYLRSLLMAAELRAVGIDSNCAPTCDLMRPETHPFLQNRCYGDTVQTVVDMARATAQGLLDGGVLPVMKHMPGHGRAQVDSHKGLPHVDAPPANLKDSDFAVFKALRDLPIGMTAHIVFDQLDAQPATTSEVMMRLIRQDIGFDGLMMTDDISMNALTGTPGERAQAARTAGCDLILFCNASLGERMQVAEASGEMDTEGLRRAARALAMRRAPGQIDIAPLEEELAALSNGAAYV